MPPLVRVDLAPKRLRRAGARRRSPVATRWRWSAASSASLIIVMAITAPLIAPSDPLKTDFRRMAKPPDARNLFGTDQVGRDTLSRVIYGARSSLIVAFASVLLGTTVGALWGVASGYLGGRFDLVQPADHGGPPVVPRPDPGHGDLDGHRHRHARRHRGHRDHPHPVRQPRDPLGRSHHPGAVLRRGGARGRRRRQLRVMARHVLPQCLAPYLVLATTHLGVAIIIEAALGFLGVGIPPPTPTWGNMLAESLTSLVPHWWLVLFPGAGHHRDRAGLQPLRRRHPRHARPAPVARLPEDDGGRAARVSGSSDHGVERGPAPPCAAAERRRNRLRRVLEALTRR